MLDALKSADPSPFKLLEYYSEADSDIFGDEVWTAQFKFAPNFKGSNVAIMVALNVPAITKNSLITKNISNWDIPMVLSASGDFDRDSRKICLDYAMAKRGYYILPRPVAYATLFELDSASSGKEIAIKFDSEGSLPLSMPRPDSESLKRCRGASGSGSDLSKADKLESLETLFLARANVSLRPPIAR
jgi:hypothetical protein